VSGATPTGISAHLAALGAAPAAFARGREAALAVVLPFPPSAVRNVAICGMTNGAAAGEMVLGACVERMLLPVSVEGGYRLPGWVGEDTLVILLSSSGATEETLTCASLATERNALCVAVTGGGKLGTHYADEGVAVVPVPVDGLPGAATVEFVAVVATLLERLGVMPLQDGEIDEALEVLTAAVEASAPGADAEANPARRLAAVLHGAVPLIWGGELTAALARRWAAQIVTHAKTPAFASQLPHLDHDELMAFPGFTPELTALVKVVALRDSRQQRQVQRRFDITQELVAPYVAGNASVAADGRGPLARLLDLLILGDHLALYLAEARGVEPGPGEIADQLAARLATTGYGRMPGTV